ncbi:MAG: hypothetical protein ACLUHK_02130 [Eubacteriales bacterium]
MKNYLFAFLCAGALTAVIAALCIPLLKKRKAEQTILKYVEEHKSKNGTPTMGGLFCYCGDRRVFRVRREAKPRRRSRRVRRGVQITGSRRFHQNKVPSERGLKPYQKIVFQVFIGLIAGGSAYKNGLTDAYLPFTKEQIDLGWLPCRSSRLSLLRSPTASI